MQQRMNIAQVEPHALKTIKTLDKYLQTTGLSNTHKELIKIRASQINGCSYSITIYSKSALKYGEKAQRLYLLATWREMSHLYTEEELCLLALTEEITLINKGGVSEETYQNATRVLGEKYLAQAIIAIITINAWNRIGVSLRMTQK